MRCENLRMPENQHDNHELPELPDSAVLAILRHMPLQQRLRCALVSRSCAAAAALILAAVATSFFMNLSGMPRRWRLQPAVESEDEADRRMLCLQSWLDSNSSIVASLQINLQLAWDDFHSTPLFRETITLGSQALLQLTSLKLQGVTLKLSPPAHSSALATLPALLELDLSQCTVTLSGFKLLRQATGCLTNLRLWGNRVVIADGGTNEAGSDTVPAAGEYMADPATSNVAAAITDLLSKNPSLVQLDISDPCLVSTWHKDQEDGYEVDDDFETIEQLHLSAALSGMHKLQYLAMLSAAFSCSNLAALPASLTALRLEGQNSDYYAVGLDNASFSLQAVTQLTRLTALQDLQLYACSLDPTILLRFPRLQDLKIGKLQVLVPGLQGNLQPVNRRDGSVALLAVMRQLTRLRGLHLMELMLDQGDNGSMDQQAERLAAITASSFLTELELRLCNRDHFPDSSLEHAPCAHMLPEGKQLPHLTSLRLLGAERHVGGPLMSAAAVQRWVQCCPALKELHIDPVEDAAVVIPALLPLHASLTFLNITGASDGDAAAAAVAQLTSLKALQLSCRNHTYAGLQPLTALQGLTRLCVFQNTEWGPLSQSGDDAPTASPKFEPGKFYHTRLRDTEESDGPDVCLQLQRLCLK